MRFRTIVLQVLAVVMLGVGIHLFLSARPLSDEAHGSMLEKRAADRFQNKRGLSPCGPYQWEVLEYAASKIRSAGLPNQDLLIVVAPSFQELQIVTIGNGAVASYRVDGEPSNAPPAINWFNGSLVPISEIQVDPRTLLRINRALGRSVDFAMSSLNFGGTDGAFYFLGRDKDSCAFTVHPTGNGPAGLLKAFADEASSGRHEPEQLLEIVKEIDRFDARGEHSEE